MASHGPFSKAQQLTLYSGDFIWASQHHYGQVYNFQVQQYKGEPYLTFWAGNDAVDGHGAGHYYMVCVLPKYSAMWHAD
jgi:hypothetical protein